MGNVKEGNTPLTSHIFKFDRDLISFSITFTCTPNPIPTQLNATQPNATHELPHCMMTQHQPQHTQHTQHKHRSIQSAKDITAETNTSTKSNPSASHAPSHSTTSPRPNGASTCNRTPAHRPISQSTRPCSTPTIESWDSIFPPAAI